MLAVHPKNIRPTDAGEWSAKEHRTLLDAVKPGEPFRQLRVHGNMRGDCRKQLGHIKNRVEPGFACLTARCSARFADVLFVANAAIKNL